MLTFILLVIAYVKNLFLFDNQMFESVEYPTSFSLQNLLSLFNLFESLGSNFLFRYPFIKIIVFVKKKHNPEVLNRFSRQKAILLYKQVPMNILKLTSGSACGCYLCVLKYAIVRDSILSYDTSLGEPCDFDWNFLSSLPNIQLLVNFGFLHARPIEVLGTSLLLKEHCWIQRHGWIKDHSFEYKSWVPLERKKNEA